MILYRLVIFAAAVFTVAPALAIEMPARKPGLWEIKMEFVGRKLPAQVMKQCVDAASDKLLNSKFGGGSQEACSKQDVAKTADGMTVDSVCKFGQATTTSHAVITGSFDSTYTMDVTSTRSGGPPVPGLPATGQTHMMLQATWLGACAAGQRAGDVIMSNGMTMNVLDMQSVPKRP